MNYWILVTHPKNFEFMKTKNIAAMKAKEKVCGKSGGDFDE